MQGVPRRIFLAFSWLTLTFGLTFLLAIFLFGWAFLKGEVGSWLPVTSLFFVVTFTFLSIKAFKKLPTTTRLN
jgi:hypothetical protein